MRSSHGALVLAGVCLLLSAVAAAGVRLGFGPDAALAPAAGKWLLLAVFIPVPWFAAACWPLGRGTSRSRLVAHVAAILLTALLWTMADALIIAALTDAVWLQQLALTLGLFYAHAIAAMLLLWGIAHAWHYRGEWLERERTAIQLHDQLTDARADALRGRLHPHFLFNTLNSIGGLALRGDRAAVQQTLRALTDMLAIVLEKERAAVTLAEELALLRSYLRIQSHRYGERLAIEWDVAEDTLDQRLPVLTLQPLVENAIAHGISRSDGGGRIRISARMQEHMLLLSVHDTGAHSAGQSVRRGYGIGLDATRVRLHEHFGNGADLELHRTETGTTAVVRMPRQPAWAGA